MDATNCPHCGRRVLMPTFAVHVGKCPDNPAVRTAIMLHMVDDDGNTRTARGYDAAVAATIADPAYTGTVPPRLEMLCAHYDTHWAMLCERWGYTPPRRSTIHRRKAGKTLAQVDAEVGAEVEAALGVTRPALEWARYEQEHGLTVATHGDGVTRGDGTPYARRLPSGGTAYMLK